MSCRDCVHYFEDEDRYKCMKGKPLAYKTGCKDFEDFGTYTKRKREEAEKGGTA